MAQVLVTESYISDIASAIRSKNGQNASYTPSQMASAIASIISAGALSIISKAISENGSYSAIGDNADAFSDVVVNVPNSYTAEDEGKVVASGGLSAQGSLSIISNSVYDTTLVSQVSVAIPESVLISKTITENGEYSPASDNADGFSQIIVSVSGGGGGNDPAILTLIGTSSGVVNNSEIASVRSYACISNPYITELTLPNCVLLGSYAFSKCDNLEKISLPLCETVGQYAFADCIKLSDIFLPNCKTISESGFTGCRSIKNISLPECEILKNMAFYQCIELASIKLQKCSNISMMAFLNCYNLLNVTLLYSSVATLATVNGFGNTPISNRTTSTGGVNGSIYVPASLVDSYKSANNWSVYADRITAYMEE